MRKVLLTFIFAFAFPFLVFSQTGIADNFDDNSTDAGWKSIPSGKFTLEETNQILKIDASKVGADWSNFEFNFSKQDISNNPILKVKIKTASNLSLRIDLVDQNGNSSNANPIVKAVASNSDFTNYTFDFTGKFGAASSSAITKAVFFFNAGGPAFTGTVYFDDLVLGDSITYTATGPIRINQVGYETHGKKIAVLEQPTSSFSASTFEITDATGTSVFTGNLVAKGEVPGWTGRYFWVADFSSFQTPGTYKVKIGAMASLPFVIDDNILFTQTAFSVIDFFTNMRNTSTGDQALSFNGPRTDVVNVYGGWWDASGDPGKYFSHLSYANYFNPQQIPFVVWSLLKSYELDKNAFSSKANDLLSEAAWGTDYLLRNLDPSGYFYLGIFDNWGNAPGSREICEWSGEAGDRSPNFQCSFREGGGMAIAALARAFNMNLQGDSNKTQYLAGAQSAYAHLKSAGDGYATKNIEYDNDHQENIIDDYTALLAATELYKATGKTEYLNDARLRTDNLLARISTEGWFRSDDAGNRPFYHAADEGMPLIALVSFMEIDASKNAEILAGLKKNLQWYFKISKEVVNPFNYMREYGKPYADGALGTARKAFFLPHANETGYWWQGENARLSSMATALLFTARKLNPGFTIGADSISTFAISQLDWILGKNPFDVCMLYGFGYNNYPDYPSANGRANTIGGICNGITAKDGDETDLDWKPYDDSNWENWRWIEQWLPHDAWYLLAVSSISNLLHTPAEPILTLASFTATPGIAGITLDWTTTSEINGKDFTIQRSSDGQGFSSIATIPATGGVNTSKTYSFTDNSSTGTSYYKLIFTDLNGNTFTSNEIVIALTKNALAKDESKLKLSPNPFINTFTLHSDNKVNQIRISTTAGQLIESIHPVSKEIVLGSNYPQGVYIVEVVSGKEKKVFKMMKLQ